MKQFKVIDGLNVQFEDYPSDGIKEFANQVEEHLKDGWKVIASGKNNNYHWAHLVK